MRDTELNAMLFSSLSGYNIYVPSKYDNAMIHTLSNTEVTVEPISKITQAEIDVKWRDLICMPIDIQHITWPIDVVEIDNHVSGLVFRKRAFPPMEPLKKLLYLSDLLDWQREKTRRVMKNLLTVFHEIHQGGYLYRAFDMNHIFYAEATGEVLVDFSLAICQNRQKSLWMSIPPETVAIEFLPPWVPFTNPTAMTLEDDLYAVAAMLFRLMIGRMPYQGRLMDGQGDIMDPMRDVDPSDHIRMFEHYHDNPVFIFDPKDTSNSIGLVTSEEKFKERWKALPPSIQQMFLQVFSKENLTAETKTVFSAQAWLKALTDAGIFKEADSVNG